MIKTKAEKMVGKTYLYATPGRCGNIDIRTVTIRFVQSITETVKTSTIDTSSYSKLFCDYSGKDEVNRRYLFENITQLAEYCIMWLNDVVSSVDCGLDLIVEKARDGEIRQIGDKRSFQDVLSGKATVGYYGELEEELCRKAAKLHLQEIKNTIKTFEMFFAVLYKKHGYEWIEDMMKRNHIPPEIHGYFTTKYKVRFDNHKKRKERFTRELTDKFKELL